MIKSRLSKTEQGDKWSFCLTAGKIGPRIRREDEQTSTPEPHTGLQGEGGACRRQGRSNRCAACRAVRRPPQSGHDVEGSAGKQGRRCVRSRRGWSGPCSGGREVAARQDR